MTTTLLGWWMHAEMTGRRVYLDGRVSAETESLAADGALTVELTLGVDGGGATVALPADLAQHVATASVPAHLDLGGLRVHLRP